MYLCSRSAITAIEAKPISNPVRISEYFSLMDEELFECLTCEGCGETFPTERTSQQCGTCNGRGWATEQLALKLVSNKQDQAKREAVQLRKQAYELDKYAEKTLKPVRYDPKDDPKDWG